MKKWLVVMLVGAFVLGLVGMAIAVELKPSIKATIERDLDAGEMITEVKLNLKVAPWAFELEYDQNLTTDTDAVFAFIAAVDVGPLNFELDRTLTADEVGDLTVTFGFSPFTFEWEKALGTDLAGVVSLIFKKSW